MLLRTAPRATRRTRAPQVRDRTLGLKAQVLRNDETIAKLLSMAVSGSGR